MNDIDLVGPLQHAIVEREPPGADAGQLFRLAQQAVLAIKYLGALLGQFSEIFGVLRRGVGAQQAFGDGGEIAQRGKVARREMAGLGVDDAEGAEGRQRVGIAVMMRAQRHTGIEADMGFALHERIVGEARIGAGILDQEQIIFMDGVRAEGLVAGRFAHLAHALGRLEPLAVLVHQRHQRDGTIEQPLRQRGQRVEFPLRRRIEDVEARQLAQAGVLQRLMHAP